jgi:tagatose-1,6-bisphosphate aldolase non-catalytic subunit AgaZ/GatZ
MNKKLREAALAANRPLMDHILQIIKDDEMQTGHKRSIFAACPNSLAVIKASLRAAKRNNAPIKFAATLNQVDMDRGYTGFNQKEFVQKIREEARAISFNGPIIIAVDHGGPWLKDVQKTENWPFDKAMDWVKRSFEAAIEAGYDLLHVDPTVDINLEKGEVIAIEWVVERTIELIVHSENHRTKLGLPPIAYEVGTEEVHGGLADMNVFRSFMKQLKSGLKQEGLEHIWPCFVVGKVGTDLHTTLFDPEVATELTREAQAYGSVIKGHYSDNVENPQDYPLSGMGAANVGPEFTEREYEGLMELEMLEDQLNEEQGQRDKAGMKAALWNAVIESGRWKKWLKGAEIGLAFDQISEERQEWLVKTGCRYIWTDPKVEEARSLLYHKLNACGILSEEIVLSHIEKAMDKYFRAFNLIDLNEQF